MPCLVSVSSHSLPLPTPTRFVFLFHRPYFLTSNIQFDYPVLCSIGSKVSSIEAPCSSVLPFVGVVVNVFCNVVAPNSASRSAYRYQLAILFETCFGDGNAFGVGLCLEFSSPAAMEGCAEEVNFWHLSYLSSQDVGTARVSLLPRRQQPS